MQHTSQVKPTKKHIWQSLLSIVALGMLANLPMPVWAETLSHERQDSADVSTSHTDELEWVELPSHVQCPTVHVWRIGQQLDAGGPCFILSHGMGGTSSGDRFHRLAAAIHKELPDACVLRIDWSELASANVWGISCPWKVAARIDEVGDHATQILKNEKLDPNHTTLIGESFGNWVNGRIARQLGGVTGILALNPAHEAGGYKPPDLRRFAQRSWSFHTYSILDTTLEIAEGDFWLETPANANHGTQHVAGIRWLTNCVEAGDCSWLNMDKPLPQRRKGYFQATATIDGRLSDQQYPRVRPEFTESNLEIIAAVPKP